MRPAACYLHFAVRPRGSNSHDEVGDAGNAVIEFVFVAMLILIPLVYFVVAVASVQRSSVAVTHAAREAGRAFATADSTDQGLQRAEGAVRLALADQGLSARCDCALRRGGWDLRVWDGHAVAKPRRTIRGVRHSTRISSRHSVADIRSWNHDSRSLCAPHR